MAVGYLALDKSATCDSAIGNSAEKLSWLQRHDKESGDLYGILPLIHGMPVALTDHIDRNPEKQLLRGKIGYVHSWVLHAEEKPAIGMS